MKRSLVGMLAPSSRIAPVACLSFVALALLNAWGCGGGDGVETKTPQTRFISLGTAPPGGAFFVVGGALAQTLDETQGDRGWHVNAEATKGTQENIRRLDSGELDFALANAAITFAARAGTGGWDKAYDVKSVMTLAPNVALFIAPRSNGVKSIADLRGKRVVVGPAGAGFEYFLRPILAAHGLSYQDFTPLNATQAGAVDMLSDGSAAAALLGGAVPTSSITQASSSQEIRFIPFAPEAREKLIAEYAFFEPAVIPPGTYRGQEEEFLGLDVGSMHLITSSGQDEELVYQVTKLLYENAEKVVRKHAAGRAINPRNVIRDTGTPFHPGALRYYRENGLLPE